MLANASEGPPQPARTRLPSAERKAAIVKTAIELFSQRGFRGTTTRELAAAVGVTEPVLYQHFLTKSDLYKAMVEEMIAEVARRDADQLERLAQENDDRAFFTQLATIILDWNLKTPYARLLLFSALEGHELAQIWYDRATNEYNTFVSAYLTRRAAAGALEISEPNQVARAFFCMVGHYGLTTSLFRSPAGCAPLENAAASFATLFLNGIRKR
jgi:TetR/AcrR family transcriptional regulator